MTDSTYTSIIWLTQGKYAIVDNEDWGALSSFFWYFNGGYAATNSMGDKIYMQKFLMNTPKSMDTDHIDRNKLNNRRCNLRICTRSQNLGNRPSYVGSSIFKGVSWNSQAKKWKVYIMKNKKSFYLGRFSDELEAAKVYNKAAVELYGEFAHLNEVG
jgi:hypothetical protein